MMGMGEWEGLSEGRCVGLDLRDDDFDVHDAVYVDVHRRVTAYLCTHTCSTEQKGATYA